MVHLHLRRVLAEARRVVHVIPGRLAVEAGQGLVEYALMLTLVAVVAIGALIFVGSQISTTLSATGAAFQPAPTCTVQYREDGRTVCR